MKAAIGKLLPDSVKSSIRESRLYRSRVAQNLAASNKRMDICAAQMAQLMHLSGIGSLEGKVCLEVGAGWVLTHALACYLLGAKKVVVTDIGPFASPKTLKTAIEKSVYYVPRDVLSPFADYQLLRDRYDRLASYKAYSFDTLKELGIEYVAPIDIAKKRVEVPADFIYSLSVLEHVPCEDISSLLDNLTQDLNLGGSMINAIHLEDHHNAHSNPFGFLAIPAAQHTRFEQTERGNRVRASRWLKYLSDIPNLETEILYRHTRPNAPMPKRIDSSIDYTDPEDLYVSHLALHSRKVAR